MTINSILTRAVLPLAAALMAQPSFAAEASSVFAQGTQVRQEAKPSPKYCARYEVPNSRILATDCRTKDEWEQRGHELGA